MMNMKKLLALLLAVMTFVSVLSPAVSAVAAEREKELQVFQSGEKVTAVTFPANQTVLLTADTTEQASDYQWQIKVPGTTTWVNIYGETEADLTLSLAMISNMCNSSGKASVRCTATVNGETVETKAVTVSAGEAEHPEVEVPEYIPAPAPISEAEKNLDAALEDAVAKQDAADAACEAAILAAEAAEEAAIKAAAAEEAALAAEAAAAEKTAALEAAKAVLDAAGEEDAAAAEAYAAAEQEAAEAKAAAEQARAAAQAAAAEAEAAVLAAESADTAAEAAQEQADAAAETYMRYGGGVSTYAARGAVLPTYTITIDYVFEDGSKAAESWYGVFTEGSQYELNVDSPEVAGYAFDRANVTKSYDAIEADEQFTVTYTPVPVDFKVVHMLQNVAGDDYVQANDFLIEGQHLTGTPVGTSYNGEDYVIERLGFKVLDFDKTIPVAADGSTVIQIRYDRLYYLMSFELSKDGYGVQPIYAPYGTTIPKSELIPSRPGYSFTGWTPTLPDTMPAENTSHKALWEVGKNVNVNLVFWYENANDSDYSYAGSTTKSVAYSEGKKVKPSDFKDETFTGRDAVHFDFNTSRNGQVALNADGSTIVNIYFTRKTYRMIFFNCMRDGHDSDTEDCYPGRDGALKIVKNWSDCVAKTYDPSGVNVWQISIYTRKWQQNVRPDWQAGIAGRANTRRWMPYAVTGATGTLIYNGTLNVSTMNIMPDADIVFWFKSKGTKTCTMNYWIEPVPGESTSGKTTKKDNGITYILKDNAPVITMMGGITKNEEYVDIEGFTKVYTWDQITAKYLTESDSAETADMFYKRNSYDLAYISDGRTVKTTKVAFEGKINGTSNTNKNYEPPYPSDWETGAYKFGGWYLAENCATGTEVNWNARMPVGGVAVYAKWEPVSHTVKTQGEGVTSKTMTALHGKTVAESSRPADPTREGYSFISWFYRDDDGKEVAFTFDMPIVKDLTVYPKWKQEEIVTGMLYFKLKGTNTDVAAPMPIESLIGETKTYSTRPAEELYEAYGIGYYPETTSTSITFGSDETKNTFTFWYVPKESETYTVKYLESGTGKELAASKSVTTRYASVVEKFEPVAGYLPDAYQKQLLLAANGTNELIFWYTKDGVRAPIVREHYIQNINDDEYSTYQETWDGYGVIGETYTEAPMTEFEGLDINGFTLNTTKSNQSGVLTSAGLELKLYYDRNLYPYEFRFVDQDGNALLDPITGTGKFEASVTQSAMEIPGYTLRADEELDANNCKTIEALAIEEGTTAVKNVKTFVYDAAYTSLTINKTVAGNVEPNQTFVFHVHGDPIRTDVADIDMYVTLGANGGSTTLYMLPVGEYTITELVDWSWRYEIDTTAATGNASTVEITLDNPRETETVFFTNKYTWNKWLSCEAYVDNIFGDYVAGN